jgi:hypothetical protein
VEHIAVDVGQAEIVAGVAVGELLMIESAKTLPSMKYDSVGSL